MTALRGACYIARDSGRCVLPREPLESAGLSTSRVAKILSNGGASNGSDLSGAEDDERDAVALRNAVFEIATVAHSHIEHARELRENLLPCAKPVLLAHVVASQHLERLRRCDFELRSASFLNPSHIRLNLALLRHTIFGGDGF